MADYAFRTIGDRLEIQRLWEQGYSPKEIAGTVGKSLDVVYTELSRGRDGTRLDAPIYAGGAFGTITQTAIPAAI